MSAIVFISCSHLSNQIVLVIITKILVSRWCNCRKCWNTRLRGCTETSFCSWQALSKIMVYELYKMPYSDLNLSNEYSVVWLNYLSYLSSLPYHLSVFLNHMSDLLSYSYPYVWAKSITSTQLLGPTVFSLLYAIVK